MPCVLPVRPRLSPDLRVFGSPSRRALQVNVPPDCSSPALQRHLSVLPLRSPLLYRRLRPTRNHPRKAPRRSCSTPQHFQIPWPFFARLRLKPRPIGLARPSEVPSPGFGYPLDGVSSQNPRRPLSAPNALGLSPSELSSSPVIEGWSPIPPPLLRFAAKPVRPRIGAPTAYSHRKSRAPSRSPNG